MNFQAKEELGEGKRKTEGRGRVGNPGKPWLLVCWSDRVLQRTQLQNEQKPGECKAVKKLEEHSRPGCKVLTDAPVGYTDRTLQSILKEIAKTLPLLRAESAVD